MININDIDLWKLNTGTYTFDNFLKKTCCQVRTLIEGAVIIAAIVEGEVESQLLGQLLDKIHAISLVLTVANQSVDALHKTGIGFVLSWVNC